MIWESELILYGKQKPKFNVQYVFPIQWRSYCISNMVYIFKMAAIWINLVIQRN